MYIGRLTPHLFHTSGYWVAEVALFRKAKFIRPGWTSELYEVTLHEDADGSYAELSAAGWEYTWIYLRKNYQQRRPQKRPTFYQTNNRFWFGIPPSTMRYDRKLKAWHNRGVFWFKFRIFIRKVK